MAWCNIQPTCKIYEGRNEVSATRWVAQVSCENRAATSRAGSSCLRVANSAGLSLSTPPAAASRQL